MEHRLSRTWIATAGIGLLLVAGAACRREPASPGPGAGADAAGESPSATAELPVEPPADAGEEAVAVEPARDEQSGLELAFGLAISEAGDLRDPVISFGRGDRVCLVAKLPSAAAGEALRVRWYDSLGAQRGEQGVVLAGSPPSGALCLEGSAALGLGNYSVELELAGRAVGDGAFTVADAREAPRRGGA